MKRQSPFADREKFKNAVENSKSISEVITYLGLRAAGGNFKQAKTWSEIHNIALPVWVSSGANLTSFKSKPDSEVFIENSNYTNRAGLKRKLLQMGWKYECSMIDCPNPEPIWRNERLSLHLDHINGIHNDNRLENLRFLCPNCHTQTETYAGKKLRIPSSSVESKLTISSTVEIKLKVSRPTKIAWPSYEEVQSMVTSIGYSATGRSLGVSDNAVRKFLKRN